MWEAAAIVVATVLYLIDKNQKWGAFWRVSVWLAKAALGLVIWSALYYYVPSTEFRVAIIVGLVVVVLACDYLKVKSSSELLVVTVLFIAALGGYRLYVGPAHSERGPQYSDIPLGYKVLPSTSPSSPSSPASGTSSKAASDPHSAPAPKSRP